MSPETSTQDWRERCQKSTSPVTKFRHRGSTKSLTMSTLHPTRLHASWRSHFHHVIHVNIHGLCLYAPPTTLRTTNFSRRSNLWLGFRLVQFQLADVMLWMVPPDCGRHNSKRNYYTAQFVIIHLTLHEFNHLLNAWMHLNNYFSSPFIIYILRGDIRLDFFHVIEFYFVVLLQIPLPHFQIALNPNP